MAKILIQNINQGGIADSDYIGSKNSVAEMVGLDIHSESGLIKANSLLVKESGTLIDDFCKAIVTISSTESYAFGSTSSKIWGRDFTGAWTLAATGSPGTGILNAIKYKGYIYYAFNDRLGRWQIGTAWSTRTDNWALFTNTTSRRPMKIINDVLYIGDTNLVAQVDGSTFSANALDIDSDFSINSFGKVNTDLLCGADDGLISRVFRWNTWSVSYSYSDSVPESSINCFLETDNNVIVQCGRKGRIYLYNGAQLEEYKRIKGVYTGSKEVYMYPNATLNFNGLPLFGVSNLSSFAALNACLLGIYSLARTSRAYPLVLNLEYPISTGNTSGIEIGAMASIDSNRFLVSWRDGNTYGIDSMTSANSQLAPYLKTRVIMVNRTQIDTYGGIAVPYRSLPSGSAIKIYKRLNNSSSFTEITETVNDSKRQMVYTKADIGDASKVQFMVVLSRGSGGSPEVEMVEINIK